MNERIVGVALYRNEDGAVVSLPQPHRHHHLFAACALLGIEIEPCTQGFTTNLGRTVDRVVGLAVAIEAEQLAMRDGKRELFSEDLW